MTNEDLAGLFDDHRVNAALAWAFVVVVLVGAGTELLLGDVTAAAFAVAVAVLAVAPVAAFRNPSIMLPWEVLAFAALPVLGRLFASFPVTEALATYLAVAAVALIVAVELHAFTAVEMTLGFAIASVLVFTTAAAGAWAVLQYGAMVFLGTPFVSTNEELMIEFVNSIVAGWFAAIVFEVYVRRTANLDRLPPEVDIR